MNFITKKDFIDPFKQTLGAEIAQSLFEEALTENGLAVTDIYSIEEANKIIETLKTKGGLVKIIAVTMSTRIILQGVLNP